MMTTKEAKTHWNRCSHFIGSEECRFGLTDVVSGYIISTCGDYRPSSAKGERVDIGYQRAFETMVFHDSGRRCQEPMCPCGGIPLADDFRELDFDGYQSEDEARKGHARMVEKYRMISS